MSRTTPEHHTQGLYLLEPDFKVVIQKLVQAIGPSDTPENCAEAGDGIQSNSTVTLHGGRFGFLVSKQHDTGYEDENWDKRGKECPRHVGIHGIAKYLGSRTQRLYRSEEGEGGHGCLPTS